MLAGVLRGKRYSLLQVLSVVLLTVGVVVSAWADSEGKVSCAQVAMVVLWECCELTKCGRANQCRWNRSLAGRTSEMA